ncbi:iron-sulfur cluster assembly accessory protein [Gorillibacterium sp. CAU 1737]|uniref:HesB/IscA family protein n=1 Tax=Gorillibacterium sp. CAU 1737 TaxID=3140362 RepID=UPI00325FE1D9
MIDISATAIEKVKEMLEEQGNPKLFLRLGVQEGGCSGFTYQMGLDDERGEGDHELSYDGLPVIVAEADLRILDGLQVDYQDSGMSGGFTIDNPNAVATCGCGSSFRTRSDAGKAEKCDD